MSEPQLPATPAAADPAAELPMAAFAYASAFTPRRPGILTAVGVVSIVVACLSALTCLCVGLETVGFFIILRMSPQMSQAATSVATTPLTAAQVAQVVASAQSKMTKLNAAQTQALTAALQAPDQQLISPLYVWSPIQSLGQDSDGTVMIGFNNGSPFGGAALDISPTGQTTTTLAGASATNPFANMKINWFTVALVGAENVASFGLAIYLFIAGILVLRDAPQSRRWHLRYAIIKIILAVFGCTVICWFVSQFVAGIPHTSGSSAAGAVISVGLFSLVSVLYPIILLFTMNSAAVRRHYAEAR